MNQEWEKHLSTLTKEDRKDPIEVIRMYCSHKSPFEMRREYYDLFMAAMYSEYFDQEDPEQKGDRMLILQLTFQLLEAAHLIDQLIREKRLTYFIKEAA